MSTVHFILFIFKDFIYLFIDRERGRDTGRGRSRHHTESNVGLDPGSPGSRPGLQAALNLCATGAAQSQLMTKILCKYFG